MASGPEKTASIFDVLYADTRRLSSLLSQFGDDGVVTEITRAASDTTAVGAGLSVKILKADTTETGSESSSRRIDPQWLLPLLFLDQAQDLIQRDITAAAIGSLVLTSGRLIVTDLSILQKMWSNPALKRQMVQAAAAKQAEQAGPGNRQERRSNAKHASKPDTTDQEVILELLPLLPHLAQANIVTPEYAVWSTLDPTNLVGTLADLVLKHGAKIAGHWSAVGILDGRPFEERPDNDYDEVLSFIERLRMGMTTDNLWKIATELGFPIRQTLGRPALSYGITPLIIFREIERPTGYNPGDWGEAEAA